MFVQFCSQNLPSFEAFWGFFGLDSHWVHEEQTSFILALVPLSSPSPNSQIVCLSVCLSVCLLALDCLSSDCVLCACFETEFFALSVEEFFCSSSSFWRSPDFLLPAFEVSAACYHQKVLLFFPLSSTLQFVDDVFFLGLMGLGS
jgi:hypothetical protein